MNPNRVLGLSPKTQDFYNYLDDHINKNIDKSKLKMFGLYKFIAWTSVSIFSFGLVVLFFGMIVLLMLELGTWIFLILAIDGISLILSIVFFAKLKNTKRINRELLINATPDNLYNKYFEIAFPNSPLKFEGLEESTFIPNYYSFVFSINGEKIKWHIAEHSEEKTWTDSKGNTHTFTVYSLEYALGLLTKSLKGYDDITLIRKKTNRIPKEIKDNEFSAASINFNKKYKVTTTGKDKIQMTRLFDPSVVQYFDEMKELTFPYEIIVKEWYITDGLAFTHWKKIDEKEPWGANINKFEYFTFNPKNYAHKVTERLEKDFERFFSCFYYFRPFDFYKIYQD